MQPAEPLWPLARAAVANRSRGRIDRLRIVVRDRWDYLNPWETVDLPKLEAKPVRTLAAEQVNDYFDWLVALEGMGIAVALLRGQGGHGLSAG